MPKVMYSMKAFLTPFPSKKNPTDSVDPLYWAPTPNVRTE